MSFRLPTRAPLQTQHFQVIVIGGGINGVAIARECALRGKRTLLVEQHDFGSGTTSRSTRIIHGGLRYLEHGEIGLVRESLRERGRLLQQRPHLVHPLNFVLALDDNSRRSALAVRTGLWLYRRLGGPTTAVDNSEFERARLERLLDRGKKFSIFNFEDAQCEFPERLVAEWLIEAVQAGATVRNYAQVLAIDVSYGRAKGVLLRDQITGAEEQVFSNFIVNASGPWADRVMQRSGVRTSQPIIGGVRGSHLVVNRFPSAPTVAIYTEAIDRRPIFVIPWNEQILIGTTEVPDQGDPGRVQPSADEIEYLLRSFNQLFPSAKLTSSDIRFCFAGVRPLPFSSSQQPSSVTRKHFLHDHTADGAANVFSVVGGKLSTAAELARRCADKLANQTTTTHRGLALAELPVASSLENLVAEVAHAGSVSEATAGAIVEWHGRRALAIAALSTDSALMRASLCEHSDHIVAEAVNAFVREHAVTLADVLLRRVPVALGPCWTDACTRRAASRIGAAMGWDEAQIVFQLERCESERTSFLRKPAGSKMMVDAAAD